MLVGVGDALIVLFFVFVLFGVGSRIAALPEGLDELVALFVVAELFESRSLLVGNDPDDVFIQPLLILLSKLGLQRFLLLFLLFFTGCALERIDFIVCRGLGRASRAARGAITGLVILGDGRTS